PRNPSASIVAKATNPWSSECGSNCRAAVVRLTDIDPGTYYFTIHRSDGWTSTTNSKYMTSGSEATTNGVLGTLPAGWTMYVEVTGPSGTRRTQTLERNGRGGVTERGGPRHAIESQGLRERETHARHAGAGGLVRRRLPEAHRQRRQGD